MRRVAAAVALTMALIGCDRPGDRATTIGPSPSPVEKTLASARVSDALITIADLPTGWSMVAESPSPSETAQGGICNQPLIKTEEAEARASVEFQKGELNDKLVQGAAAYGSTKEAGEAFAELQGRVNQCTDWEDRSDPEVVVRWKLAPLSFPKLGDETLAVRLNGEIKSAKEEDFGISGSAEANVVVIRRSNAISTVAHIAIAIFGPAKLDSQETETISRVADEKFSAAF